MLNITKATSIVQKIRK